MLSYQNDPALKSRFMAHVTRHRELDSIEQGTYGHVRAGQWRGCAVACSLRSLDEIDGVQPRDSGNDHAWLAERLGIPLVLTYLQDQIFEGLPKEDALQWPSQFAAAIPVGRDMAMVWPKLALWLLSDQESGVQHFASRDQTRESIARVAALFERHIAGDPPSAEEWRSATAAATTAAAAAAAAARRSHYQAMAKKLLELMEAA